MADAAIKCPSCGTVIAIRVMIENEERASLRSCGLKELRNENLRQGTER
jgi:hypothetical protein